MMEVMALGKEDSRYRGTDAPGEPCGREVSDEGKDGDRAHSNANATLLAGKNKKWQPMDSYIMTTFRGSDFCIIHVSFAFQK